MKHVYYGTVFQLGLRLLNQPVNGNDTPLFLRNLKLGEQILDPRPLWDFNRHTLFRVIPRETASQQTK